MELMGFALPPWERTVQKGPFDGIDGIDGVSPGFIPGLARFHSGSCPVSFRVSPGLSGSDVYRSLSYFVRVCLNVSLVSCVPLGGGVPG